MKDKYTAIKINILIYYIIMLLRYYVNWIMLFYFIKSEYWAKIIYIVFNQVCDISQILFLILE